jgi:hypothetical protein
MKPRMQNGWRWLAGAICAGSLTLCSEPSPAQTLAVLCSSELRESGLAALSLVPLAKVDGLRLVDRERLHLVAREYQAGVFSAEAIETVIAAASEGRLPNDITSVLESVAGKWINHPARSGNGIPVRANSDR